MAFITVDNIPFQSLITSTKLNTIHEQITDGLSDGTKDVNIGQLDVDNININGNIISSTNANGDVNIAPNGSGETVISSLDSTPIGANTQSTGAFTTIATDSNEALKIDIITGTEAVAATSTAAVIVAHGKSTSIRGVSVAGYDSTSGVATDYNVNIDDALGKGVNETNVHILVRNNNISGKTISYAITIFYV